VQLLYLYLHTDDIHHFFTMIKLHNGTKPGFKFLWIRIIGTGMFSAFQASKTKSSKCKTINIFAALFMINIFITPSYETEMVKQYTAEVNVQRQTLICVWLIL